MRTTHYLAAALLLAVPALPHERAGCKTLLTLDDVVSSLGKEVRLQPVFSRQQWRGWRVYNVSSSNQLAPLGIREGQMMTHVCAVSANDAFIAKGDICCAADATKSFEITFRDPDGDRTVRIVRR
jgi:hypothetical protein